MTKTEPKTEENPFDIFFKDDEKSVDYCAARARIEFTEEIVSRMKQLGIKKGELAEKMGRQAGFVTRLLSGRNNFELETMVRLAMALDCKFHSHLAPVGTESCWLNFLNDEPEDCPDKIISENFRTKTKDEFQIDAPLLTTA